MIRRLTNVLTGLAVTAIAAVLLLPGPRWVAISHWDRSLPSAWTIVDAYLPVGDDEDEDKDQRTDEMRRNRWLPKLDAFAARHPDDAGIQVAYALRGVAQWEGQEEQREASRRLHALLPRFPADPVVLATLLRKESSLVLPKDGPSRATPAQIAAFGRLAARAERLDPNNGYFSALRAVGFLAAGRDRAAMEALHRASTCSAWNDYTGDLIRGQTRLLEAFTRPGNPWSRTAVLVEPNLEHLTPLRRLAERVVNLAADAERSGQTAEGLRLRHDAMRLGALMRIQGRSIFTNMAGVSIVAIATGRPGGASDIRKTSPGLTGARRAEARHEAYDRYLQRLGREDERRWVRAQLAAGNTDKVIHLDGGAIFEPLSLILGYTGYWAASLFVLSLAVGLTVVALGSRILEEIHDRAGEEVYAATGWGLGIALATGFIGMAARALEVNTGYLFPASGVGAVLVALAAILLRSRLLGWGSVAYAAGIVLQATLPGGSGILPCIASTMWTSPQRARDVASSFRRVRAWAIPLAAIATLVYAGLVFRAGSDRTRLLSGLDQMSTHEGRFYADLVGREWR